MLIIEVLFVNAKLQKAVPVIVLPYLLTQKDFGELETRVLEFPVLRQAISALTLGLETFLRG